MRLDFGKLTILYNQEGRTVRFQKDWLSANDCEYFFAVLAQKNKAVNSVYDADPPVIEDLPISFDSRYIFDKVFRVKLPRDFKVIHFSKATFKEDNNEKSGQSYAMVEASVKSISKLKKVNNWADEKIALDENDFHLSNSYRTYLDWWKLVSNNTDYKRNSSDNQSGIDPPAM